MVSACSVEDDLKTATYPFSGERYYFAVNSMIILVYHVLLLLFCLIQEIEKSKCGKLWRPDGIVFIARSCFFLICANYFSLILKRFFFSFWRTLFGCHLSTISILWSTFQESTAHKWKKWTFSRVSWPQYVTWFGQRLRGRQLSSLTWHLCRCFYLCLMFTYIQTGSPRGLFVLMTFMESLRQLKMDTCFIDKQ